MYTTLVLFFFIHLCVCMFFISSSVFWLFLLSLCAELLTNTHTHTHGLNINCFNAQLQQELTTEINKQPKLWIFLLILFFFVFTSTKLWPRKSLYIQTFMWMCVCKAFIISPILHCANVCVCVCMCVYLL